MTILTILAIMTILVMLDIIAILVIMAISRGLSLYFTEYPDSSHNTDVINLKIPHTGDKESLDACG